MLKTFENVIALFLSLVILLTGHGLQLTLVPLYANALGFSSLIIGITGSFYFLGFVVGCLSVPRLVAAVGHIRMFLVLACTANAALLLLGLFDNPLLWMLARFTTGWALAGLYMIFESWLNENAGVENRGFILSTYALLTLLAIGAGQLLSGINLEFRDLITLAAILLALGSVPVGITRSKAPAPVQLSGFQFRAVIRSSQVAVLGALTAGFVTSGFWALGPLVATAHGVPVERVGIFMALTIVGGALAQLPAGRLSDRLDRRLVILFMVIIAVLDCAAVVTLSARYSLVIYPAMMLFGATTFPLYSLCLAHANDNTRLNLLQVGSVILLMQSLGAVIGPLVIATTIQRIESGFFIAAGTALVALTLWLVVRIFYHNVDRRFFEPFHAVPRTTQEALELSQPDETDQAA
ncbi:MAG: MFS transporter [Gammaproteobacteria bacterium]|nr:MFS transporter [Pseudomonadales bacterium]MCP5349220.1 MFS transporter [Pseudomonadales bacterium]